MKFYLPTSTLNFDAIYSSTCIMPPRYYCDEAIWFPRYFKTDVDLSDDVLVLYSDPIIWEISDYDSENYPMLIGVDSSIIDRQLSGSERVAKISLQSSLSCIVTNTPVVFDANDILSGRVKIFFRSSEEKKNLVTRARIGVSESKLPTALTSFDVDITCAGFPEDVVDFYSIKDETLSAINSSGLKFSQNAFEEFERQDRIAGAKAGFYAGKLLRSLHNGYCLDCFRGGLDYEAWKGTLPCEFSAIIDMLCGMIGFRWDVNRDAIVDFCTKCWQTCFETSRNREAAYHKQWHEILRAIAKSYKDVTFSYPVAAIQDCYMQAIACFIKTGKRYKQLAESIRDDNIAIPELALALHGALVGYSVFSRVLFEKRSYVDEEKEIGESTIKKPGSEVLDPSIIRDKKGSQIKDVSKISSGELSGWAKQVWENFKRILPAQGKKRSQIEKSLYQALLDCKDEHELLRVLPQKYQSEGWGSRTKVYTGLKKLITDSKEVDLFDKPAQSSQTGDLLLIRDAELPDVIAARFADIGEMRVCLLKDVVRKFIAKYMPNGYYGRHPERYKQLNPDIIDHMIRCFSSQSTPELNFKFNDTEEECFVAFLEGRYHCKRKIR